MKRKFWSFFTLLVLCLALLPMSALADESADTSAIRMGLADISGYDATAAAYDYIYYGTWNGNPIKWRVLDTKTNTGEANALFLLTDECLENTMMLFNPTDKTDRHLWQGSDVQKWCKETFYNGAFTDVERVLIPAVSKTDKALLDVYNNIVEAIQAGMPMNFQKGSLDQENVFFLSWEERTNTNYGISDYGKKYWYWLRSYFMEKDNGVYSNHTTTILPGGSFGGDYTNSYKAFARPAMNLSTADGNILFVSSAVGGKPANGLSSIPQYSGSEWKLTLSDSSRSDFDVTTKEVTAFTIGGNIKIAYSGAKTGSNEYVSVLVMDANGNPTYYGRSAANLNAASGTAAIAVPAGLAEGTYTLKVFNEQYNGDKKTDYAGAFTDVTLKVEKAVTYTVTYDPGANGKGTQFTDTKIQDIDLALSDKTFTRDGYIQVGWTTIDGGEKNYNLGDIYTANAAITLYPVWERDYKLYVDGTKVTEQNKNDVLNNGGCVKFEYDEANGKGILTLNNVNIDSADKYVINAETFGLLEIVLVGENKLRAEDICIVAKNLIFSGEGSVKIVSDGEYAFGTPAIDCPNGITVKGGNITAEGKAYAVWAENTINVDGGTLTLIATNANDDHAMAIDSLADPIITINSDLLLMTDTNPNGAGAKVTDTSDKNTINAAKYVKVISKHLPIIYDLDGGKAGENRPAEHIYGTATVIPNPTRSGYTFVGWLVNDGTEAVKNLTLGAEDYTVSVNLKATWKKRSSGGFSASATYPVNIPSKPEHGTVTADPKTAGSGDTVTITTKPDSGYVLETITATGKNGNELTITDKGGGKYTFIMPNSEVDVKATFMEDNAVLNFFYDVPNDAYYYEAVKWAVDKGITNGVGDNLFAPDWFCTRAQIVTFLWRAAGSPEPKSISSFSDVPGDSYYAKAVAWAVENNITKGTSADKFSPEDTCTRAQAVTFLARALNGKATGKAEFSDVPSDSYFADAVAWAVENGVTNGVGGNLFAPYDNCTRAQIVTFLWRAYNK